METPIKTFQEQHKNFPNPKQWADLPKDVLLDIIQYLDLKMDVPRLRGVCPSWRSAVPLHELPVHKYYVQVPNLDPENKLPLFLLETKLNLFTPLSTGDGNCSSWIARLGETGTNKLQLLSPSDYNHYHKIVRKYIYTDPPISGEINLLDCHVHELARPVRLVEELDHNAKSLSKKIVGEWDLTSSRIFTVLVKLEDNGRSDLLLLRSGEKEWFKVLCNAVVHDIAFHKGKFYVFYDWKVGVINPSNSSISNEVTYSRDILRASSNVHSTIYDYVLGIYFIPSKSNGCLYLIIYACEDTMFVFLLKDLESNKWERVENLGEDIIFMFFYHLLFPPLQ